MSSAEVRARVERARKRQAERGAATNPRTRTNTELPDAALDDLAKLTPEARTPLGRAVDRLRLSVRAARRIQRVARTIADLEDERSLGPGALAEALSYREEQELRAQAAFTLLFLLIVVPNAASATLIATDIPD